MEIVCAQPRRTSIICSEEVKPFAARIAANSPLAAARPGLKLLFIEPNDSRRPTGCEAASPRAKTVCSTVSPIVNRLPSRSTSVAVVTWSRLTPPVICWRMVHTAPTPMGSRGKTTDWYNA